MLDFTFPNLFMIGGAYTLMLAGVPVLIHLINMLRHRRVEWAAMEFLLLSQRKNRTWIILKQLLLMLLRMAAIAAIICLIAEPKVRNEFGRMFGTTKTHHIILLDDSFSMSEHWAGTSAFAEAKRTVGHIGEAVTRPTHPQTFTLIRFSGVARGLAPDLFEETVDKHEFTNKLTQTLGRIDVSETSAGPTETLASIEQLFDQDTADQRIVYLVSDFRARQWDEPTDLQQQLRRLDAAGVVIQLINCVDTPRPNLAVTSLVPGKGIRASGVPWFMEVSVRNFGDQAVRNVSVLLEEDGHARPAVRIDRILPDKAVTKRFPVHFPTAGQHQIVARLESDAITTDNSRYGVVELPLDVPVLLVDGSPDARDARFMSVVASPGGPVRTGVSPRIETTAFLNRRMPLEEFRTICLLNVERLDPSGVESLEQYVSGGGGLAVFLGDRCRSGFINESLYRDGEGFFPLPLAGQRDLPVDRLERAPDLQVEPHPIFKILAGKQNSFVSMVLVERYFAARDGWQPEPDSTTRVIARLRNGAPLAVERRFGEGRVVAFLTTAAPDWNNWARNPSFVVAMQDMHAYLAQRPRSESGRRVGTSIELELDPQQYAEDVSFVTPAADATRTISAKATATKEGPLAVSLLETGTSGVYEAVLGRTDGNNEIRRYAINVEADEGQTKALSGDQLAARLTGVNYIYKRASMFEHTETDLAGSNITDWCLLLLLLLLIGEQILAFSASYHPPVRSAPARTRGGSA